MQTYRQIMRLVKLLPHKRPKTAAERRRQEVLNVARQLLVAAGAALLDGKTRLGGTTAQVIRRFHLRQHKPATVTAALRTLSFLAHKDCRERMAHSPGLKIEPILSRGPFETWTFRVE